mmetsp:Transcript_81064/g.194479  ORF Transcript_81064/g.194479 Transcript_81064/m.194479 type:complete len:372 (+) Transcript_81064:528-1643(+)
MLYSDLIADDVPAEHAGVFVEVHEGLILLGTTHAHLVGHGICDTVSGNAARNKPSVLLVGANNRLHHHESNGIRTLPGNRLPTSRDISQRPHLVVAVEELCTTEVRLGGVHPGRASLDTAQSFLCQLDKLLVLHGARSCKNHLVSCEVSLMVLFQLLLRQRLNAFKRPNCGESQGVVAEGTCMKPVINNLASWLLCFLELAQDPLLLFGQVPQGRSSDHVCQNVDALRDVALEHSHVEGGLLSTIAQVQGRPERLDLCLKLGHGPLARASEGELFQQVRGTSSVLRLIPDASIQIDANRGGLGKGLLSCHPDPVGESGDFHWRLIPCHWLGQDLRDMSGQPRAHAARHTAKHSNGPKPGGSGPVSFLSRTP